MTGVGGEAINLLATIEDHSADFPVTPIGNRWSRQYYDGLFHVFNAPPERPAVSLVFVQSRNGNTVARHPSDLGGGVTDKCLIYEGLSRVAADAVLAGASSVGHDAFFTIRQPEMIDLRLSLGLPRHPAQAVMSERGHLDLTSRLFSDPAVPVFILAGEQCERVIAPQLGDRPWITMIPVRGSLARALEILRSDHGIGRISAIGGRTAATQLVDAGLVQDIYLTTSGIDAGEADTPWYAGPRAPRLQTVVRKREVTVRSPLLFEHLAIG